MKQYTTVKLDLAVIYWTFTKENKCSKNTVQI